MKAILTQPRPFLVGDEDLIQLALLQANAIAHAVYAPVPDLISLLPPRGAAPFHRPKAESKEKP